MLIITNKQSGTILVVVLVITMLFISMATALTGISFSEMRLYKQQTAKQQALHIAEAGVNYYRWHLAHDQDDFQDGTGIAGPYTHDYTDPSNSMAGHFKLEITPPPTGSTIVKIKSTGWVDEYPNSTRAVEVRYGIPSLAHFSFLTNADAWFGNNERVVGEMHSNGGVRMDGTNDSLVASSRQNYVCQSGHGCNTQATCHAPCSWSNPNCTCPGVWGVGLNSPLWSYPVVTVDFNSITADLNNLQSIAGVTLNTTGSNKGYHIIFKANGHFDAKLVSAVGNINQFDDTWTSWVNTPETITTEGIATDYTIPANGVIFVNDGDVWVEGTVKGRVTLVAATLPDNVNKRRTIHIVNNLQYLARDGTNVLGLIAQKNIKVVRGAPNNLIIDGVLLAQNGRVFHNRYNTASVKNSIEVYGSVLTNQTWTWSWVSGASTIDGYKITNSIYDPLLTYAPPPSFPTTGQYAFISWEEK
ncbi:MAG: pilus assembly PilX N-terminal domain-containing protein [Candidatus Falkowbacteria bacterium]